MLGKFAVLGALCAAQTEDCYLPIDVMFLQDTTGSFVDDLPNVVSQIPEMVTAILEQNPNSYFGVSEFKDKPYYPLGETSDFCYKLDGALKEDVNEFQNDYSLLYASGGGDLPEVQYQALINVASDSNAKWRPIVPNSDSKANAGAHLVILSTDAVPHLPGDMQKYADYPDGNVPQDLPQYQLGDLTPDAQCREYDYATPQQMRDVLKAQNIFLAILTPNDPAVVPSWQWVNEQLLEQPADFYQFIQSDSSDLISGVLASIKAVTSFACAQSTTPAPTTTTPTTTTTTTTTTPTTTTTTTTTTLTTTTTPTTTTLTTTTTTTPTTTTTTTTTTPTTTTTTATTTPTTTTTTTATTPTTTTTPSTTTTTTPPTTATTTTTTPTTTTTTPSTTKTPSTTTTTTMTTTTATTTTLTTTTPTTTTTRVSTSSSTTSSLPSTMTPSTEAQTLVDQGELQTSAGSQVAPPHCHNPCPPLPEPCCHRPSILIKVNNSPKKLVIDYEAPDYRSE